MQRTPVCCTDYTSPNSLWLQIRWDSGQKLKELMVSATKWAAQNQSVSSMESKPLRSSDDQVLARPMGWNLWFRAKILGPAGDKLWLIKLTDFGSRLTLPERPDRLQPMPEHFSEQKLASCAVLCRLARIRQKSNWSNKDAKLLEGLLTMATEDLILDAEIDWEKYTIDQDIPVPVELFQRGSGHSINDIFGQRTRTLITKPRSSRPVDYLPVHPIPMQQPNLNRRSEDEKTNKPFEGCVSHVTDRGIVFVQRNSKLLAGLQNQLELFSESEDLQRFSARSPPSKDEIFAVFREPPLCHYRGRVLELLGEERVRLLIVDFGFELTVDWRQCARLPRNIRYDPQCEPFLPSRLASRDCISECQSGKPLATLWKEANKASSVAHRVTVSPEDGDSDPGEAQTANIEVHLPDGGRKDIIDFLRNSEKISDKHIAKSEIRNYRLCRDNLNWDVDNIVCGTCTHVTANAPEQSTFFKPNSMQATADQLKLKLGQLSVDVLSRPSIELLTAHLSSSKSTWPVLIQSEDGKTFQRGSVDKIDAITKATCDVTFVDTGRTAAGIPVERLFTLPDEFLDVPTTCVKCQIADTAVSIGNLKAGDVRIFTIVGVADGAYKLCFVGSEM